MHPAVSPSFNLLGNTLLTFLQYKMNAPYVPNNETPDGRRDFVLSDIGERFECLLHPPASILQVPIMTQSSLEEPWELGLSSKLPGLVHHRHIPMADLLGSAPIRLSDLRHTSDHLQSPPVFVNSGNSFHVYWPQMRLTQAEWMAFLGWLLLDARESDRVDTKWVACALMRGFGVLRWSGRHKPMPSVMQMPDPEADFDALFSTAVGVPIVQAGTPFPTLRSVGTNMAEDSSPIEELYHLDR